MFNAAGSVTSEHAHETVALQTTRGISIDISAGAILVPILHDADHAIGIYSVDFLFTTAADTATGSFDVGIISDTNAIVAAQSVDTDVIGAHAAGTTLSATLATTLTDKVFKHGGKPIVQPGNTIVCSATGTNTAAGYVQITFWRVQPST